MDEAALRNAIRFGRLACRLTQMELGRATGITHIRISRFENGYSKPRADELKKLAAVLGLDFRDCEAKP